MSRTTTPPTITKQYIKNLFTKAADRNGIHPAEVSISMLNELDERITSWELRKFGGLKLFKDMFPVEDKRLGDISQSKKDNSYVRKLETELGDKERVEQILMSAIKLNIKPVVVKPCKTKFKKGATSRHVVGMLNDTHFGLTVVPEEVAGVNEFNWTVASRRVAMFIEEMCNYKIEKRHEVQEAHLVLNGDLIAGAIHGLLGRDNDLITHQFNGAVHILTHSVARLAEAFNKVIVYFSPGNHGDHPHRREGGRVMSQVYDSLESMVFYALSVAHSKTKNVSFKMNKGLLQDLSLPAGRAAFTHGHLLFSKQLGNPGNTVNTKNLGDALMRFNEGEASKGNKKVRLLLLGHTHAHFHVTTRDGVQIYNAPSLSGIDSYAYQLGINHNLVGQLIFESTDKYIFGDSRLIIISEADKNSKYDQIIPPYTYELVCK